MKKLIAVLTAALCFASLAAFTACGEKKSDVVTEDEWISAMSAYNALNVTVTGAYTSTYTETTGGKTETYKSDGNVVVKTALSITGTNITGNTYAYGDETEADSDGSETESSTTYEIFLEESYSSVTKYETKYAEINYLTGLSEETVETDWDGYISQYFAGTPNSSEAFYMIKTVMTMISANYEDFEYADGAYKYVEDDASSQSSSSDETVSGAVYVKIDDGKLYSIVAEETEELKTSTTTYATVSRYEFTFTNYGSTYVTVPQEYTYEYYYLSHVV